MDNKNPLLEHTAALVSNLKKFDKLYTELNSEIRQQEKDKLLLEDNINQMNNELKKVIEEKELFEDKREHILTLLEQAEAQKEKMSKEYSELLTSLKKEREHLY